MIKHFLSALKIVWAEDEGQDLIEYALVAALVGIAAVSAMRVLDNAIGGTFNNIGGSLTNATGAAGSATQ